MSDCHDLFLKFLDVIKLADSKKDDLRSARDAIRDKIKTYFKDKLKKRIPEFQSQGSFAMSCVVNPLSGEFDIDDGVYLQNLDDEKSKWESPSTVHSWILEAVRGHTKEESIDKRTCVRIVYSGNYHVDLPIYGTYNQKPYLAEKGNAGWHISDPVEYTNWFIGKVKEKREQLRRILMYLKAWAEYKSTSTNVLNSFVLSILSANYYISSDRDDVAFSGTAKNIYDGINRSQVIINPVVSNENLGDRMTDSQWKFSRDKFLTLLQSAGEALKAEGKEEASKIWRKEFGGRFPEYKEPKEGIKPIKTSAPAILGDNGRSA
jgi:hypothetical protein